MAREEGAPQGEGRFRSAEGSFDEPDDVLDREDLDYEAKLDILQRWQVAAKEAGGESDDRQVLRIEQAIERLQTEVTLDPSKPEEAPSGKGYRPDD